MIGWKYLKILKQLFEMHVYRFPSTFRISASVLPICQEAPKTEYTFIYGPMGAKLERQA